MIFAFLPHRLAVPTVAYLQDHYLDVESARFSPIA